MQVAWERGEARLHLCKVAWERRKTTWHLCKSGQERRKADLHPYKRARSAETGTYTSDSPARSAGKPAAPGSCSGARNREL